jgi:hypothetical protein
MNILAAFLNSLDLSQSALLYNFCHLDQLGLEESCRKLFPFWRVGGAVRVSHKDGLSHQVVELVSGRVVLRDCGVLVHKEVLKWLGPCDVQKRHAEKTQTHDWWQLVRFKLLLETLLQVESGRFGVNYILHHHGVGEVVPPVDKGNPCSPVPPVCGQPDKAVDHF